MYCPADNLKCPIGGCKKGYTSKASERRYINNLGQAQGLDDKKLKRPKRDVTL